MAASYAGCNRALVVTLFTIAMTTMAGFYPGKLEISHDERIKIEFIDSQEWKWIAWISLQTMLQIWWRWLMESELWQELSGKTLHSLNSLNNSVLIHHSPYLVGVLTPNRSLNEWRIVFWIVFGVFNVTNIVYIIWASGEVQPWNEGYLPKKSEENGSHFDDNLKSKQIDEEKCESLK